MFGNFLFKQFFKSKLKDVPPADQEKMMALIQKNPDLFKKIVSEAQEKMKQGKDQMTAVMEVVQEHQTELKDMMK